VLAINPKHGPVVKPDISPIAATQMTDISTGWRLLHPETKEVLANDLVDWATIDGYENFSGTLTYERILDVTPQILDGKEWALNLGKVHDFAEVFCNDLPCGVRLWEPFRFEIPLKSGQNTLQVSVTNSMANQMEKASLSSGMLGPVTLDS
jgi:hypothetical protein